MHDLEETLFIHILRELFRRPLETLTEVITTAEDMYALQSILLKFTINFKRLGVYCLFVKIKNLWNFQHMHTHILTHLLSKTTRL